MSISFDYKAYLQTAKENASRLNIKKSLCIVSCGSDPASEIYVKNKARDFLECNIPVDIRRFPSSIKPEDLRSEIYKLNATKSIGGIIVQLPLPKGIDIDDILASVVPSKDVDGISVFKTSINYQSKIRPCTAKGVISMLSRITNLAGKLVVVCGRSKIVGRPLIPLLIDKGATPVCCNSFTPIEKRNELCKMADVIISAVGIPNFITADIVKEGAIVIDVGINRLEDKCIVGDVDYEAVSKKAAYVSPVPGGVGLLTRAELLNNFVTLNKVNT